MSKLFNMKKLLLVISLVSAAISANAQCTPGSAYPSANWADTAIAPGYGAWPDTVENFPPAVVGVPYSTSLNFMVPTEVTAEVAGSDPTAQGFIGTPIDRFSVTGVTGLPAGVTYACNISTCEYPSGPTLQCASISGVFPTAGTYNIEIGVEAILIVGFPPFTTEFPYSTTFTGYKVIVGTAGLIDAVINPIEVYPNPASDKVTISGLNNQMKINGVKITNMEGKVIRTVDVTSPSVDVELSGVENGIYFVVVEHANGTETVKFVKE
jgi:hypothetical protein